MDMHIIIHFGTFPSNFQSASKFTMHNLPPSSKLSYFTPKTNVCS